MKKLKLKKKVKVITTLLSFGMLLTVLPSMNLVAEDDTTTADTSDVSVGPYIKYEPTEDNYYSDEVSSDTDFATLEANGGTPVATDGVTKPVVNDDGSYTYNESVTVDKTITKETKKNTNNQDEDVYKLDMSASSLSNIVNVNAGVDYILMIDTSSYITDTRLLALKDALYSFVDNVYDRAPGSRIAFVKYNTEATVLTNNADEVDEDETKRKVDPSALVTVKTHKDNLLDLIGKKVIDDSVTGKHHYEGGLTANTSIGSYSDLAMFEALKIFQQANTDQHKDDLGQEYRNRTRVTILFSAGLPGKGKYDANNPDEEDQNEDKTYNGGYASYLDNGWTFSARNVAQATMSMATIMKYTRGVIKEFSVSENDSSVASGKSWSNLRNDYTDLSTAGCGSTVYTVGLNLDPATDPSTITTYDALKDFADISFSNRQYSVNFKVTTRQAALVNEYLYRVSSHRKTGEHFLYSDYVTDVTKEQKLEKTFKDKYDNLPSVTLNNNYYYSLKNLYGNNLYYFYPDSLTRDLNNGYFLTAKDKNLDRLTEIFKQIAQQVGSTYEGLSVRDYIDSSFVPVSIDENGVIHELAEGSTLGTSSDGKYIGTLRKDQTNRWYIEWSDVKLSPESSANKGDAKTFNESIYVKPVDGIIGGNNLYTNTPDSGVYVGEENKFPFPQPSVDIPINYEILKNDQNIYLTNSVNLADLISNKPDGIKNKGVKVTYTFTLGDVIKTLTYDSGSNQGIWSDGFSGTVGFDDGLMDDQNYKISCTIESVNKSDDKLIKSTSHHIHDEVMNLESKTTANINVFKPELKYHDLHIYYGDSKPDYSSALSNTSWKHGDTLANDVTMNGSAPGLNLVYFDSPDESGYSTIVFPTKNDYQVGVNVFVGENNITENTAFARSTDECKNIKHSEDLDKENKKRFIVHIDTCSLKITKSGGSADETYVFDIMKDGTKYSEVSITGNGSIILSELPVGTYSIVEDTDLSWRYKSDGTDQHPGPVYSDNETLSSSHTSGEITCTNTKSNDKWLSKVTSAVQNVFGGEEHHSSKPHSTN